MNMYYDVVVSIYENEKFDTRTDSELVCGGFETEKEAEEYVWKDNRFLCHKK